MTKKVLVVGLLAMGLGGLFACKYEELGSVELELERILPPTSQPWPASVAEVVYTFTIHNASPYTYRGGVVALTLNQKEHTFMDTRATPILPGQRGLFTVSVSATEAQGQPLWQELARYGQPTVRITSFKQGP